MTTLSSLRHHLALVLAAAAAVCWMSLVPTCGAAAATSSSSTLVTQALSFTTPGGTVLHATVAGAGSLSPRPLIVEDSPYAPAVSTLSWVGPQFNLVELQWRGTGLSGGSLNATGSEDQSDLSEFLGWACTQPWSNGSIGLYGFSASAIIVYNSMHLPLPCVKATALMAGTTDLYRDLLDIGGIPNIAAGIYVEAAIGSDTLADGPTRFETEPMTIPAAALGYVCGYRRAVEHDRGRLLAAANVPGRSRPHSDPGRHQLLRRRTRWTLCRLQCHKGIRQPPPGLRGTRRIHQLGIPGPFPQYENWFDHYLLGQPLSTANQPVVSAYLGNGNRAQFLSGNVTHLTGIDVATGRDELDDPVPLGHP